MCVNTKVLLTIIGILIVIVVKWLLTTRLRLVGNLITTYFAFGSVGKITVTNRRSLVNNSLMITVPEKVPSRVLFALKVPCRPLFTTEEPVENLQSASKLFVTHILSNP